METRKNIFDLELTIDEELELRKKLKDFKEKIEKQILEKIELEFDCKCKNCRGHQK